MKPLPRRYLAFAVLLVALFAAGWALAPTIATRALRTAASRRGFSASFMDARLGWGPSLRLTRLALVRPASGDTVVFAESIEVRVSLGTLLRGHVRPSAIRLAHASILALSARAADPDTLARRADAARVDRSGRVRAAADQLVSLLLVPARALPGIELRDVVVRRISAEGDTSGVRLDRLRLAVSSGAIRLEAAGTLDLDAPVPFTGRLSYEKDDRLGGDWTFDLPGARAAGTASSAPASWPLRIRAEGRLHQDTQRGRIEALAPTRVWIGDIALSISGHVDRAGPALHLGLAADSLTDEILKRSLPPPLLGPLAQVATVGRWDYRLGLDLDVSRPDSVDFSADVIPHDLALDPRATRLNLFALDQPFTAVIHLPHDRLVTRDLARENPHFRPLDSIDPLLPYAVVTNEDGAFFRHRGFNTESVKGSIADNIRAGSYRRGAGTITMQLARNLWLGHARTLARKAQEVMLAWTLEHLTGLGKNRLLEIYLNIIEWGPDVHGADEAAHFYFGHDAGKLTVDEALFLTIIVPSPARWRWRFDAAGELRPYAREQMHFIGRAMVAKGWLDPQRLPPVSELRVTLRGPARAAFAPAKEPSAD